MPRACREATSRLGDQHGGSVRREMGWGQRALRPPFQGNVSESTPPTSEIRIPSLRQFHIYVGACWPRNLLPGPARRSSHPARGRGATRRAPRGAPAPQARISGSRGRGGERGGGGESGCSTGGSGGSAGGTGGGGDVGGLKGDGGGLEGLCPSASLDASSRSRSSSKRKGTARPPKMSATTMMLAMRATRMRVQDEPRLAPSGDLE